MRSLLRAALFILPGLALAQTPPPAAPAAVCMPLAEAKSGMTPPDLHRSVLECVAKDRFEPAAELFALANIYASFDAERVADKSAGQAKKVMIADTFAKVPEDKRARFNTALQRMATTPENLARLCSQIAKVGKPDYHPLYMVIHGMKVLNPNPPGSGLVKDFDAAGAWKKLQEDYLNCP